MGEMHPRDLHPPPAAALDSGVDGGPGGTPTEDAELGILVTDDRYRRNVLGDAGDLGRPQLDHALVVGRRVVDVTAAVVLLQPPDAVRQPRCAGYRPRPCQRL